MNRLFGRKGSKKGESPYYRGHGYKQSKPSSENSSVQSNSTIQKSLLSCISSEDQEIPLRNIGATTNGHGSIGGKQSLVDPEVPSATGSIFSKSPVFCVVPEVCESHLSMKDSGSSSLLPIININDGLSSMMAGNLVAPKSNSLDSKASSDPYYIDETTKAVRVLDKFQEHKIEETRATEDKYLINNNEGFVENPSLITRKGHSTNVQAPYKTGVRNVLLVHSAAFFYKPESIQSEENMVCDSIIHLNKYLKTSKAEIEAGVPGKFLSIVIGKELSDLGSIVSVITYAYYLKAISKCSQLCTVPVINMKRADLPLFPEVEWLFESCCIEQASLIFIDEINLSYYYQFGSLKMVLVDSHRLSVNQEIYKDAIVEVLNCKQVDSIYPWLNSVIVEQMASFCTLVAENFALSSPTILAGHGLSRLLLAGILLDTANLTSHQCTEKDKCMATLLIKGARQIGRNGLFLKLKHKMFDISNMKIKDILRKNFKDWTIKHGKTNGCSFKGETVRAGMSSIGVSISELLTRGVIILEEIFNFIKTQELFCMVIVTGYYDNLRKFKRELVIAGENIDIVDSLVHFFNTHALLLQPKQIHQF
ncbi:hypothetical protein KI387_032452, partial [Taxus chinensis]